MIKKRVVLCLVLSLLVGCFIPACASEVPAEMTDTATLAMGLQYLRIRTLSAALIPSSGGLLEMSASISTQTGTATSVKLTMSLYRLDSTWTYVTGWTKTGTTSADWVYSYYGTPGRYYKLEVTGEASKDGSTERASVSTWEKLCQ